MKQISFFSHFSVLGNVYGTENLPNGVNYKILPSFNFILAEVAKGRNVVQFHHAAFKVFDISDSETRKAKKIS